MWLSLEVTCNWLYQESLFYNTLLLGVLTEKIHLTRLSTLNPLSQFLSLNGIKISLNKFFI